MIFIWSVSCTLLNRETIRRAVGGGFAGVTAAESLKRRPGDHHQVTLVSKYPEFIFYSAQIRLAFGRCDLDDVFFDLRQAMIDRGTGIGSKLRLSRRNRSGNNWAAMKLRRRCVRRLMIMTLSASGRPASGSRSAKEIREGVWRRAHL